MSEMQPSLEQLMLEAEKESLKEAARVAKKHNTNLVFWENGKIVKRPPTQKDLTGSDIEKINLDE